MSHVFFISNCVCQGSVLSPVFAVYLDGLLQKLVLIATGGLSLLVQCVMQMY